MKHALLPVFLGALIGVLPWLGVTATGQVSFQIHATGVRGVVHDLSVGDTNGDGRGDAVLATTDAAGRHLIVFAGTQAGTLSEVWSEDLAAAHGSDTTLNLAPVIGAASGPLDLVLNNVQPSFRMGAGDGSFERAWAPVAENGEVADAAVGDFDGDGKIDNAILLDDFGTLLCFGSGNGNGTFTITWLQDAAWTADADLEFARFDDNLQADAIIGDSKGLRVVLQPATTAIKKTLSMLAFSDIAVADVDADGNLDAIGSVPGAGALVIHRGKGDGRFDPPLQWPAGLGPDDLAVADLDGDGQLDLAVTDPPGSAVQVLFGQGGGSFSAPQAFPLSSALGQLDAIDINGDGRVDLVLAHTSAHKLTTLINRSGG